MAREIVTQYYDDLDNTPLNADEVRIISFAVEGKEYLLDLSPANARKFHETLQPYVDVAREPDKLKQTNIDPAEVREWAKAQQMEVARRGKIPNDVIEAYRKAHA